jgi:hypothetical protein
VNGTPTAVVVARRVVLGCVLRDARRFLCVSSCLTLEAWSTRLYLQPLKYGPPRLSLFAFDWPLGIQARPFASLICEFCGKVGRAGSATPVIGSFTPYIAY